MDRLIAILLWTLFCVSWLYYTYPKEEFWLAFAIIFYLTGNFVILATKDKR